MINKIRETIASKLPAGSFARNVITLMTGTTFAQVLTIIVAPILTRLYGPEDYGVSALYTSILGIFTVIACWRYELAIVLPKKDRDAANVMALSISICFGMAVLTLVLVAFFRIPIANILGAPELASWLWFMPLSLIAAGLFQAFNYWSTRRKQFKRLAARTITQSTVTAITRLGAGLVLNPGPGGLIGGSIFGQLVATGQLAWQIIRDEGRIIISYVNIKNFKRVLVRYKRFPLFDSWASMLNTASTMLPALLLGYFFTPAVVGHYSLGQNILAAPMGVIGGSIAQVFFPQASEARHGGNLGQLTLDMFQRLLTLGFVPILLIAVVAPDLFAIIFGEQWWAAGVYVRWLSLWMLFVFISSPISTTYTVLERQREYLIVNVILFSTRLVALIIGGIRGDALLTIALFGITSAVLYIFNCIYILYMAGVTVRETFTAIMKQIIQGVPYVLLPTIVWYSSYNSLAFVLAGIGAGIIFLLVQAYRIKNRGV
jgi:O-antigen/teichoic acid export membrane protein